MKRFFGLLAVSCCFALPSAKAVPVMVSVSAYWTAANGDTFSIGGTAFDDGNGLIEGYGPGGWGGQQGALSLGGSLDQWDIRMTYVGNIVTSLATGGYGLRDANNFNGAGGRLEGAGGYVARGPRFLGDTRPYSTQSISVTGALTVYVNNRVLRGVPDAGSTLALLAFGLSGVWIAARSRRPS